MHHLLGVPGLHGTVNMPQQINQGMGRGGGRHSSGASTLPSHTEQIMNSFLINNKRTTSRHEQRKYEEEQRAILSRLKRPSATTTNGTTLQQRTDEVQPFFPPQVTKEAPINRNHRQPQHQQQMSSRSDTQNSSTSNADSSWTDQIQHSTTNQSNSNLYRSQNGMQTSVPNNMRLQQSRINDYHQQMPNVQSQREVQPLIPNNNRQQTQLRSVPTQISNTNVRWSGTSNNISNQNTISNQRSHNNNNLHQNNATMHKTPTTKSYQPMNTTQISIDEEDDYVCCDPNGGHWREGTKNICTISLWALIVFAIFNRLFVHMNMAMHHNKSSPRGSVVPKDVGSASAVLVPIAVETEQQQQKFVETEQPSEYVRMVDGGAKF